uniref:G-protein coupled receptors family 1 profile domain-containing protein n=1 Tax=Parascaris univalens TaxID=6257 RepID=A0A915A8Y1_PARUN
TATCKIAGSLQGFGIFLSTFSIAAIALDRYVLVIFPTKRKRQHNLSLLFFSLIWLISIALALPLLIASDLNTIFEDHNCDISLRICHEKNEIWQQMPIGKEAYTLAVLVTQYALPLISIVFAYTRIAHRMQGQFAVRMSSCANSLAIMSHRRRSVVERQRRTHLLLMCVVIMFAVAWLPLNVFHVLNTFGIVKGFSVPLFALCHVIAMGSACLNPVSYAFFNHNFRQQFVAMFEQAGISRLRGILAHLRKKCMLGGRRKYAATSCTVASNNSPPMLPGTLHNEEFYEEHDAAPKESEFILRINMVNTV